MTTRRPLSIRQRALVAVVSHVLMISSLVVLVARREPAGLQLNDATAIISFGFASVLPALLLLIPVSRGTTTVGALAHVASPFVLIAVVGDDLTFAVFAWWFWLPAFMLWLVAIDRIIYGSYKSIDPESR